MRNRPLILILLLLFVFMNMTLSGCWNRREVQQIIIGTGLGIDIVHLDGKVQYRLSVLVLQTAQATTTGDTTQMGGQASVGTARVISSQGDTLYDAVRNWNLRSSRQLFLGHTLIIVLGDSITPEEFGQVLDFINRHKDIRFRTLVVAYNGKAEEALQAHPEFESLASMEIQQLILQNGPRVSKIGAVNVFQMTYDLLTPGRQLVLPRLQLVTPPESLSQSLSSEDKSDDIGPQNKVVQVDGSSLFKGYQQVGWMNDYETQGMLFIKNQFRGGIIPVSLLGQNYSILLSKASSEIKPEYNGDRLVINVKVKATGAIQEGGSEINEITPQNIRQFEQALNQEVTHRCNAAISKSHKLDTDVFGFGDKIHRVEPEMWKNISEQWDEIYSGVEVRISSDCHIEHYGLVK